MQITSQNVVKCGRVVRLEQHTELKIERLLYNRRSPCCFTVGLHLWFKQWCADAQSLRSGMVGVCMKICGQESAS